MTFRLSVLREDYYESFSNLSKIQADFPAITFCKGDDGYKRSVLNQNGINKELDYKGRTNHSWFSLNPNVTPQVRIITLTED